MAGRLRSLRLIGLLAITATCFTPVAQKLASTPTEVNMAAGDTVSIPMAGARVSSSSNQQVATASSESSSALTVTSTSPGNADISTRIFGLIPWKTHVHVTPSTKVVVGGQAVGIRLQSKGPIVVGFRQLADGSSPSAKAHIQVGDMIIAIDRHVIHSAADLQRALENAKEPVHVTVERGSVRRELDVSAPNQSPGNRHQLGLYVRDRTVGVGTLTFYDPPRHTFGALGHIITDTDTGQAVVGSGGLYSAMITGLKPGRIGSPGEKRGTFSTSSDQLGRIGRNTPYGVFGTMIKPPSSCDVNQLVQVALPEQVHEGPAKMFTVVHGQKVEAFNVQIDNVARQSAPATKSMIVKVTDPRLLAETGGIIQGMSGSPLVQDGKLVGAVTHVFVSDPTRGYAVYAMWMVHQAKFDTDLQPTFHYYPFLNHSKQAV
ncbi:SpoIVB peptidase [Alicyclobacillus dauci]|uniref:SpoIVB peptidase n=1 Tax=Alicyclobacillus dauci TaxID=1475485 RepID=A0ABY6ZAA2_9BACL|nr:SpoIVB peptidase [Alicyclobacillus dauci]WAH39020.1 SpoIVB peptidase [Alicyclobacillus dauci]